MDTKQDDVVIHALKQRFFQLAVQEDYPRTPKITEECDNLVTAIRNLQGKIITNAA